VGKASSSKKVQRAAKAAASSRGTGEKRERGFPLLVLAVVLLGVGLVFAARSSRDELVAPFRTDHWHAAYEIYDCGTLQPAVLTELGPDGIHTHADSLLHIHPRNSSATGNEARLGVFMDGSGLEINTDLIDATGSFDTGFELVDNSTGCDGSESEIVVTRWNVDGPAGLEAETTYRGDFADIRFLHEREAFTIAKVPVGEDAPAPSAAVLARLDTNTGTTNLESDPLDDLLLDDLLSDDLLSDDEATDDGATDDGTTDEVEDDEVVPDEGTTDETTTDGGDGASESDSE